MLSGGNKTGSFNDPAFENDSLADAHQHAEKAASGNESQQRSKGNSFSYPNPIMSSDRNSVSTTALMMSMKKAPTIGMMRKACGHRQVERRPAWRVRGQPGIRPE